MSAGSNPEDIHERVVRVEVKLDTIIQMMQEDRERDRTALLDHETRLREIERAGDIAERLVGHDKRLSTAERWIHALPVGLVITFVVAVGGLVSYVGGLPPS